MGLPRGPDSWPAESPAYGRSCMPLTSFETDLPPRLCGNLRPARLRELPTAGIDSGVLSVAVQQCSRLDPGGTLRTPCPFFAAAPRLVIPPNDCPHSRS